MFISIQTENRPYRKVNRFIIYDCLKLTECPSLIFSSNCSYTLFFFFPLLYFYFILITISYTNFFLCCFLICKFYATIECQQHFCFSRTFPPILFGLAMQPLITLLDSYFTQVDNLIKIINYNNLSLRNYNLTSICYVLYVN